MDSDGRGKGRSVYICQNPVCLETTFRRNKLSAAFRTPIPKEEQDRLREELTDQ